MLMDYVNIFRFCGRMEQPPVGEPSFGEPCRPAERTEPAERELHFPLLRKLLPLLPQ